MKVAHVTTIDMSLRFLLLHQLLTIQEAGYEVTGVSAPGAEVAFVEAAGIRHIAVPLTRAMSPLRDLASLLSLYRVFRREKFDVVHTHTPKGGLLGQYAALFAGVPVRVHTIHGLYLPAHATGWKRQAFLALEKIAMRFSHYNLSQNPEDVALAIREHLVDADKLELLGNGIDVSHFDPERFSPEARRAKRRELGLEDHHLVVGMVARLVREKGYLEMLEAAQIIRAQCPEARFIFVGGVEPDKPDALAPSILAEKGLSDVAQFLGHRTDLAELYATMDVSALPSYREGFPRVPMEAAAMGLATVVTDVRGCRETVTHGMTGYLVPRADAPALADALLLLLKDPELRGRFGVAARAKALAEFDERVIFRRVLKTYERLCRTRLGRTTALESAIRADEST